MKKMISFRVSQYTLSNINQIQKLTGMSKTEMISIAVNNLLVDIIFDAEIFSYLKSELILYKINKSRIKGKEKDKLLARLKSLGGYKDNFYPLFLQSNIDYIIRLIDGTAKEYRPEDSRFERINKEKE